MMCIFGEQNGDVEMENNQLFRHELKYQCSAAQLEIIRNRLMVLMNYDLHAVNGQYTIRSLYFDNYDNRCFYENESGTDPREKYRIRIYNANIDRISLECKRKECGKTYKTACLLSNAEYDELLHGGNLSSLLTKHKLLRKFTVLMHMQRFQPAVIVEYDRTPFVCPVGNVRVTLDQNIRSSNAFSQFFSEIIPTRQILPQGQHLIEVKYDELLPDYIKDVLQIGTLQQSTFSKYYLCRKNSMGGQL